MHFQVPAMPDPRAASQIDMPRDKKYEGYSRLEPKAASTVGKRGGKEQKKDKKIDEEFIHNLQQHIYYLEMQLKLL